MIDLDELIAQANDLEPLPASATRLAGLLAGEDWEIEDIVQAVSLDIALSGRLLGVANSAMSATVRQISTVQDAVVRLGPGALLSLAVGSAVRGLMNRPLSQYGFSEGQLWSHSVAAALAAEHLRTQAKLKVSQLSFCAALLHDLGRLVLARFIEPRILVWLNRARNEGGLSSLEAESEILGVHHAELGGLITRQWGLPDPIASGISNHHTPSKAPDEESRGIASAVFLADLIAGQVGAGLVPIKQAEDRDSVMEYLKLSEEGYEHVLERVRDELDDVMSRYQ